MSSNNPRENFVYPKALMNKRILYLHPHFTLPGGASRHTLETGRELARRGWEVHIASLRHDSRLISEYEALEFHTLGGPLPNSIFYWLQLPALLHRVNKLVAQVSPDILFSQVFPANWWGFFVKILSGASVRHAWMCHEPSAFIHSKRWLRALPYTATGILARALNPALRLLDVKLARSVDAVIANSSFSRELARHTYRYSPSMLSFCYPGVDVQRFKWDASAPKIRYQFITCARLTKFKNIDKIIRAVALIDDPSVTLSIIGSGEAYDSLIALSQSLNMDRRISFQKTVSDAEMVQAFQSSFALVHAAEEEPFGLTPVEAMACGTPVIAIAGGGPAETVIPDRTGYLCSSASETEIASAMQRLIDRDALGISMREACILQAQRFTWQRAVDTLEDVFNQLLNDFHSSPEPRFNVRTDPAHITNE